MASRRKIWLGAGCWYPAEAIGKWGRELMGIVIDQWPPSAPRTSLRSSLGATGENQRIDIVCAEGIVAMFMGIDIVFGRVKRAV